MMHQAGILGESFSDAKQYGWKVTSEGHDWTKMVTSIQDHIGSLNFGYRTALRDNNVTYMVRLYKVNTVDPWLESAWFRPSNLQLKTRFKDLLTNSTCTATT
jgi:hypothetical protein